MNQKTQTHKQNFIQEQENLQNLWKSVKKNKKIKKVWKSVKILQPFLLLVK